MKNIGHGAGSFLLHHQRREPGDAVGGRGVNRFEDRAQLVGNVLVGDRCPLDVIFGNGNEGAYIVGLNSGVFVGLDRSLKD